MIKKTYNDIGEVVMIKKSNVKNINLRITPFEPIKITMPYYTSTKKAEEFLFANINQIKAHKEKLSKSAKRYQIIDENSNFNTKHHQLQINKTQSHKASISITDGIINFRYPEKMNIANDKIQLFIREAIEEAWRIEARQHIPMRLKYFSEKYHLEYSGLTLKRLKSRWGSCSAHNRININVKVMQLPDHLIDYVLLHELAHIKEKNHQLSFWRFLEQICPNAKNLDKELTKFNPQVF